MKITKKDIITIVLLSIIFFGIASWNVGTFNAPVTNWERTEQESFFIDLGSTQQVYKVYFWVKSGNASVTIYSGVPDNWSELGQLVLQPRDTDYSVQQSLNLNVNTQYLEFSVQPINYDSRPMFSNWGITNPTDQEPSPYVQVSEVGIESQNNQQIPIVGITGENATDSTLTALVDEQTSLQIPPTYMSKMYFDEVYFARSAENYANNQIPEERTHPPLGKLIQALGVLVFGETPFGWRIAGIIFATLMIPLIYLLGKKLFGTWIGGFSAAFLLVFDFMHFTMARIGTSDTYVVFFSLLSQLFFLTYFMNVVKNGWRTSVFPLFMAVVFFALGFSTKWFILYSALGLLALLVAIRFKEIVKLKGSLSDKYVAFFDHPFLLLLGFVGIMAVIYFATYIPEMIMGNSIGTIFNLQLSMLSFHSSLSTTDSFSSPWWSWPFMVSPTGNVPRWFDITYLPNGIVSTISVFGNPAVWWVGFACIIMLAEKAFHVRESAANLWHKISKLTDQNINIGVNRWDLSAIFIVVVFFFSWLPYVFISRVTYIYHFYLCVPLICLAITYFLNKYWNKPIGKVAATSIFVAAMALFILFYPVISGAPVSSSYIHNYLKWSPSWFFAP